MAWWQPTAEGFKPPPAPAEEEEEGEAEEGVGGEKE